MSSVVPLNEWKGIYTWCKKASELQGIAVRRVSVEARFGANASEYTPPFTRGDDDRWTCGSVVIDGDGQAGPEWRRLADAIVGAVSEQFEGYTPSPRVTLRLHGWGKDGRTRPVVPGVDYFSVSGDPGEDHAPSGREDYSATALLKREGIVQAVQAGDMTKLMPYMLGAVMESFERVSGTMNTMCARLMSSNETLAAENKNLMVETLTAYRHQIAAQGEADSERLARAAVEKDDDVKRQLIAMFGRQIGRAIDLGMVKFAGISPDDPEMKREFIRGMLSRPEVMQDVSEAIQAGTVDPAALLPALETWSRTNPAAAVALGERFLETLSKLPETS